MKRQSHFWKSVSRRLCGIIICLTAIPGQVLSAGMVLLSARTNVDNSFFSVFEEASISRCLGVMLIAKGREIHIKGIAPGGLAESGGLQVGDHLISLLNVSSSELILFAGKNNWDAAYEIDAKSGFTNLLTFQRNVEGRKTGHQFGFSAPEHFRNIESFARPGANAHSWYMTGNTFYEGLDDVDRARYLLMQEEASAGKNVVTHSSNGYVYYKYLIPGKFRQQEMPTNYGGNSIRSPRLVELYTPPLSWVSVTNGTSKYEVVKRLGPPLSFSPAPPLGKGEAWTYGFLRFNTNCFNESFEFKLYFVGSVLIAKEDPFDGDFSDGIPTVPRLTPFTTNEVKHGTAESIVLKWRPSSGKYPIEYEIEGTMLFDHSQPRAFVLRTSIPIASISDSVLRSIVWRVRASNSLGVSHWSQFRTNGFSKEVIQLGGGVR